LASWNVAENGKEHGLYIQNDRQIVLTRADDPLNTLHMAHSNFDLLRECCLEATNIAIPEEAVEALKQRL
jgi:hypothetical protein